MTIVLKIAYVVLEMLGKDSGAIWRMALVTLRGKPGNGRAKQGSKAGERQAAG